RDDVAPGLARRDARAAVRYRWARAPRRDARVGHARAVARGRSPAAGGARPAYDAGCGAEHFSDRSSGAAEHAIERRRRAVPLDGACRQPLDRPRSEIADARHRAKRLSRGRAGGERLYVALADAAVDRSFRTAG